MGSKVYLSYQNILDPLIVTLSVTPTCLKYVFNLKINMLYIQNGNENENFDSIKNVKHYTHIKNKQKKPVHY